MPAVSATGIRRPRQPVVRCSSTEGRRGRERNRAREQERHKRDLRGPPPPPAAPRLQGPTTSTSETPTRGTLERCGIAEGGVLPPRAHSPSVFLSPGGYTALSFSTPLEGMRAHSPLQTPNRPHSLGFPAPPSSGSLAPPCSRWSPGIPSRGMVYFAGPASGRLIVYHAQSSSDAAGIGAGSVSPCNFRIDCWLK